MPAENDEEFLELYASELAYLRERGADFAASYPKIASRLGVEGHHVSDPHVERLLESFAFLTARLQRGLERDLPELTTSLLGVLYPPYTSPIPSLAIASFEIDPGDAKLTSGHTIEKHTPLVAEAHGGTACRFRTAYPLTLWPITVEQAGFIPPESIDLPPGSGGTAAILKIRLSTPGISLAALGVDKLRFFLNGSDLLCYRLYDLLFVHARRVLVTDAKGRISGDARLEPVGFAPDEDVLPYPTHAHAGYRLIQEYFAFPEKFLFIDFHLDRLPDAPECELLVLFDQRPPSGVSVSADTFRLGCTPIVNLFPRSTEPIRVDHRRPEYRLVPDARRERITEIHSIREVTATAPGEPEAKVYEPFFSYRHHTPDTEPRAFWHARRVGTGRKDIPGTDVYLNFVDLDFSPRRPPSETVYASVLCTNRDLAEEMTAGVPLHPERGAAMAQIICLTKPTPQKPAPLGGQALWRLVSNLSLNHLSLSSGPQGAEALRELLRAYLFTESPQADRQIAGIVDTRSRTVTRRMGKDAWRGFCRGTEVTLTLEEERFVGSSPVLFASVLSHFFALYAHINSFTELCLKSSARDEVWKRWPPMVGEKALL